MGLTICGTTTTASLSGARIASIIKAERDSATSIMHTGAQKHGSVLTGKGGIVMTDREKVIKKAERIICSTVDRDMIDSFCEDVIVLLKEQEPVEAKIIGESKSYGSWWFACGACGHAIDVEDKYCRECGSEVKWDD